MMASTCRVRVLLIAALLVLPLAGCLSDQKEAVARCTATAKALHHRQANQSEEEYTDSLDEPISTCMKAAGYLYYSDQPDCDALYSNPYCYYPKDRPQPRPQG